MSADDEAKQGLLAGEEQAAATPPGASDASGGKNDADDKYGEAFGKFDEDNSGFITIGELRHVMAELGHDVTEEQTLRLFNKMDADHNHKIDFAEFKAVVSQFKGNAAGEITADSVGDGFQKLIDADTVVHVAQ